MQPTHEKHPAHRARVISAGIATMAAVGMVGGLAVAQPREQTSDDPTGSSSTTVTPSTRPRSSSTTTPGRSGRGLRTSPSPTQPDSNLGGSAQTPSTTTPQAQSRPKARSHAS